MEKYFDLISKRKEANDNNDGVPKKSLKQQADDSAVTVSRGREIVLFHYRYALSVVKDELPVLKEWIRNHLIILQQKLSQYFPDLNIFHCDWVKNPFNKSAIKAAHFVDLVAQEQLLELSMDRSLQLKHNKMDLGSFWITAQHDYPDISTRAFHVLLPFATTYLCESAFSSLL